MDSWNELPGPMCKFLESFERCFSLKEPEQELLFHTYTNDVSMRSLLFTYTKDVV